MTNATDHDIAERVQESLAGKPPIGPRLEVAETAVRREDDWWYVPVVVDDAIERTDEYYTLLADVEDDLRDRHGFNVTLVPDLNIVKLLPNSPSVRPMYVQLDDWQRLCFAAKINPHKTAYDPAQCQAIAAVIRHNPAIITFDPPAWSNEVADFFDSCGGLSLR